MSAKIALGDTPLKKVFLGDILIYEQGGTPVSGDYVQYGPNREILGASLENLTNMDFMFYFNPTVGIYPITSVPKVTSAQSTCTTNTAFTGFAFDEMPELINGTSMCASSGNTKVYITPKLRDGTAMYAGCAGVVSIPPNASFNELVQADQIFRGTSIPTINISLPKCTSANYFVGYVTAGVQANTVITSLTLDIPLAASIMYLAANCTSLEYLWLNAPKASSATSLVLNATALKNVYLYLRGVVSTSGIISSSGNPNIETFEGYFDNAISMSAMFSGHKKVQQIILYAPKVTSMSQWARMTTALQYIKVTGQNITDISQMCYGCTALTTVVLETGSVLSTANAAFTDCGLDADSINDILRVLPSWTSGSHVITFTGCPGAATCDPTIGTAKGWTVQL